MDYNKELQNLFVKFPFLFTSHKGTLDDYFLYFKEKYDCNWSFRIPIFADLNRVIPAFEGNIVQTFSTVNHQYGTIIVNTMLQISPTQHVTLAYVENNDKLVGSLAAHLTNPVDFIPILKTFHDFEVKDEKRVVGFGSS
jgi:hypothetical protein